MSDDYEITEIPDPLIFDKALTYFERLMLMALLSHSCGNKRVKIKQDTLAADFGCTQTYCNQVLKSIIDKGYLKRTKGMSGSTYEFLFRIKKGM